jgi:hypothetical protein
MKKIMIGILVTLFGVFGLINNARMVDYTIFGKNFRPSPGEFFADFMGWLIVFLIGLGFLIWGLFNRFIKKH